jgi:pre-mRNA-processing factor 6
MEEHAGRMVAARKLIKQGCDQCPKSEDVWLEVTRLLVRGLDILSSEDKAHIITQQIDDAKIILPDAAQHLGQSVKVWLAAADLEHDVKAKKRVSRRGTTSLFPPSFTGSFVT